MGHLSVAHMAVLVIAGIVAGAINAMAGGGSLISFPALLFVGYSPLVANVTNTVALVPGYLGGSLAYRPELADQRENLKTLGPISLLGGLVGAILLVTLPATVFKHIVPWLILFACALLLLQPLVRDWLQKGEGGRRNMILLFVTQFLASVYGGYFGAGLGVLMLATLGVFLVDTLQRVNALKGLLSLIINLISAIYFAIFGPVAWLPVIVMAAASLLGGHLGVQVAKRMSNTVLRGFVVVFGVAVAIKLLLPA